MTNSSKSFTKFMAASAVFTMGFLSVPTVTLLDI